MSSSISESFKPGDQLEVTVEKIAPRGFGIARVEGRVLFIPMAAPLDRLLVRIAEVKSGLGFAEIISVIEASPFRVAPYCQYYNVCGGCDFQHLDYPAQLQSKLEIMIDCLKRIAKLEALPEIEVIPSPEKFNYRRRAQVHFRPIDGRFGFYKRNSREIVDIDYCPVASKELNSAFNELRRILASKESELSSKKSNKTKLFLSERKNTSDNKTFSLNKSLSKTEKEKSTEQTIELQGIITENPGFSNNAENSSAGKPINYLIAAESDSEFSYFANRPKEKKAMLLTTKLGEFEILYSAEVFFQANKYLTETLVERATVSLSGDIAIDIYSGVGTFSIPLTRSFRKVFAVEENAASARLARMNAKRNKLGNFVAINATAKDFILNFRESDVDAVILDPPRSGIENVVIQKVIQMRPREISYVSCEPSSLARDIGKLVNAGYEITHFTILDMFPQTHHLESVVRLALKL